VYFDSDNYNITDINEFINEHIKGVHLTKSNVRFIEKKLIPLYKLIFYKIFNSIFNFS
jgi:hypothetical protein